MPLAVRTSARAVHRLSGWSRKIGRVRRCTADDRRWRGPGQLAHKHHLPLVIASRPHDPLRATEAAILNLEPRSFEAALADIGSDGTSEDERRLARIVETGTS